MAPMMIWPWPPMLNRPERNASPTDSPARISGVAVTRVSEIGDMISVKLPLDSVEGSKTAPSKSALYASQIDSQPKMKVSHG